MVDFFPSKIVEFNAREKNYKRNTWEKKKKEEKTSKGNKDENSILK